MKKRILSLTLAMALCMGLAVTPALAAGESPAVSSNRDAQNYTTWSKPVNSYLYENGEGGLTRVEYINGKIVAEDYSSSFQLQNSQTIPMELSIWGGFFAGENYNFLVFGQENPSENDNTEVIRVVKYSKDWKRLGQASLRGANTTVPFDAGSLRMDEYNGYLYIRTCHEMYQYTDGLNHQANLMLAVQQSDMSVTDAYYDIWNTDYGYVSHSFNQFILVDEEGRIVTLDHGDANPRAMTFMRYYSNAGTGTFSGQTYGQWCSVGKQRVFAGTPGNNTTGASVGGLAETADCYMMAYNYDGVGGTGDRNVYLQAMDIATGRGKDYQITQSGGSTTPVLAPTGLDGGYLLWNDKQGYTIGDTLYYLAYGSDGVPGEIQTAQAPLSDCQPIPYDGGVVWYVTDNSAPVFYTLDDAGVTRHGGEDTPEQPIQPEEPEQPIQPSQSLTAGRPSGSETVYENWGVEFSNYPKRVSDDEMQYVFPAGTVMYVPALGTTETWGLLHNGDYAWFDFPYENEDIIGLDGSTTLKGISVQNSAGQWSPISVPSAGGYLALEPGVQYRATFSAVHTPTGRQIEYQPVFQADASSSGTEPAGFEAAYEWEGLLFSNRPVMPVTDWSKRTFPAGTVVFVPPKGGVSDYNDGFVRREASYGLCGENGEPTGNLADVPNNGLWLTLTPGASYVVHYLEMSTDATDPSFTERMPYFTAAESTDQFLPEPDANGFVIGNKEQYLAYVQAHADDVFQVEAAVPDDAKILIQYAGTGGEVKIPQGVTFIGSGAFRMQEDVTRVTIPEGVTTIDSGAFYNCYQMKSVVIPESVNYIGSSAFAYCSGLTSVTIPSGLTQLKEDVFLNCSSLASVTIPASVTRIESGAFFYCGELDDVYFGGTEALWNAIDLTGVWDPRVQIHFGSVDQPEQPAQPVSDFSDVPASFWGSPYIQKAAQANLMTGTGNGTFEPNGNLTLAQAMVLAYQIHSQANGGSLPQTSGAWYMPYYQYCINHSLIAAGQFDSSQLNQTASRFDMVAILDKAIPADRMTAVTDVPDGAIPDLNEDDAYGDLVYRWYRAGIVTGDQKGQFNGTSSITRAETAVILCQINNLV